MKILVASTSTKFQLLESLWNALGAHCELTHYKFSGGSSAPLNEVIARADLAIRWAIKDIAGMYFSAMEIGLTRRDLFRFMCLYTGESLRNTLREDAGFWQRVEQRAQRLYQKGLRKGIVGLAKDKQGLPNE